MKKVTKSVALLAVLGFGAGFGVVAARDVLHPQMAPEKGSFDKPAGKLGETPERPWSVTTVAAAVDAKPVPGKVLKVTGEIIDLSCYLSLGKHGGKHRDCGQKCLKNGQPIGLLTKEGTVYVLMEEEHDPRRDGLTTFRQAAIDNMAHVMEITGTFSEVAGIKSLYVTGYVKK